MSDPLLIVFCTCPANGTAERLAEGLVSGGYAACVNIVPKLRSIYPWMGELQNDEEDLMLIKTSQSAYDSLESALVDLHPYEVPEIIAVSISKGLTGYLEWVRECTSKP
jgi:periplasmic divalent cation tolerance protein